MYKISSITYYRNVVISRANSMTMAMAMVMAMIIVATY